jgi:hypothetical protein
MKYTVAVMKTADLKIRFTWTLKSAFVATRPKNGIAAFEYNCYSSTTPEAVKTLILRAGPGKQCLAETSFGNGPNAVDVAEHLRYPIDKHAQLRVEMPVRRIHDVE